MFNAEADLFWRVASGGKLAHSFSAMGATPKSLRGQLLLDGGDLAGSFFHHAVVLICQHDADGAFGLVLNRPTGKKVGAALVADLPDAFKTAPLFHGGPVQPTAFSFLHADNFLPDASVLPNLDLNHSVADLVELAESFSPTQKIKIFAGYAGWTAGQLDAEMKRKAWLTHPASVELVFDTPMEKLWREILHRKGAPFKLLAQMPDDLSAN
ncbi:MAG: hypothetical protein RLZZ350_1373 [Verrucomicrobiota bacterium]